ncbi:uncharacterized protein LOC123320972 [Coccinella septempunctata]|uniref:uncharacterized protein LOC123320972 n=1 Tax=Coccinella septempunctata TaxID=41139 RepID=UPI001D06F969|nr:uncharacterized protein LOC123320972 [Coccinella septempunctata]
MSSVVYKIPCLDCDRSYIGQTRQYLKDRIKQHKYDTKNINNKEKTALTYHVFGEGHNFNFEEVEILDVESNGYKRNISELGTWDIKTTVNRLKNWTTPGIDGIHNFWWKSLTSTHGVLARLFQQVLRNPQTIPQYLTRGITIMLPKKGNLAMPQNYRPITCLPSAYKILTSTLSFKINNHLTKNNIMAWEQNGCRRKGRGSKELLVIDHNITKQAKKKLKNISMAWIDYQKAFDSVPHSWLIEVLSIYKVNKQVIELLAFLMSTWRTTLKINTKISCYETGEIRIKRGLFQGDGLSALWFCLALNLLSNMLNRSAYGYSMNDQTQLTHLFYMDDLKLYARGRKQLEGELELVRKFSADICMTLGLDKCAAVEVRRGKLIKQDPIRLADDTEMRVMDIEDRYRYLGIQQTNELRQQENKKIAEEELMRRTRKILGTQLSAKNKMVALNIWAMPPLTYTAGILSWSKTDLERVERTIRITLTRYGMLHPNSAVERLYLPRKEGGRGLSSLEDACKSEKKKITSYFLSKNLPVHQWVAAYQGSPRTPGDTEEEDPATGNRSNELKRRWQEKPLHGRFFASLRQDEVDLTGSNSYLTQGYLFPQTEGTLFAIQDQVVPTRSYIKNIMKQEIESTKCRLCHNAEESVQHLASGCSAIAGTKYLSRHNNMGKVVHQQMCLKEELLHHFTPHHQYVPQEIIENDHVKIYWDFTIVTDQSVGHNRPDMVVWYKKEKTALIVDFAVPQDYNLQSTYAEKISKYEMLSRQMRDMWHLRKVMIMSIRWRETKLEGLLLFFSPFPTVFLLQQPSQRRDYTGEVLYETTVPAGNSKKSTQFSDGFRCWQRHYRRNFVGIGTDAIGGDDMSKVQC